MKRATAATKSRHAAGTEAFVAASGVTAHKIKRVRFRATNVYRKAVFICRPAVETTWRDCDIEKRFVQKQR